MKSKLRIMIASTLLTMVACNQKEKNTDVVVSEATEVPLAHTSDKTFENVLTAIDNGDYKIAGGRLIEATDELKAEANELEEDNRPDLQTELSMLSKYSDDLRNGTKVDLGDLKQLIAGAELKVYHNYLVEDDVYVVSIPDNVEDARFMHHVNRTRANLEEGTKKLEGEAKKSGEDLMTEGKKLDEEYQTWKKRVEEHFKKVDDHFKKHQPEYVYPQAME